MQTLTIEVQDSFMPELLNFIYTKNDFVSIKQDKNIEIDPHFYARKQELKQLREDVKSGDMEMLSQEQYDKEIEAFFEKFAK